MEASLVSPSVMSTGLSHDKINGSKRKRKNAQSPDTAASDEGGEDVDERSKPPTKRACNECRQQKLRCDVKTDPFTRCARCTRLNLNCRIDANFKRIGKRSKNAEMEREIVELRRQLAMQSSDSYTQANGDHLQGTTALDQGAAGSLLDLRNSHETNIPHKIQESSTRMVLGRTVLETDEIGPLFDEFWLHYHPYLPLLDPGRPPQFYYDLSPLLFWVIIAVAARRYEEDTTLLLGLAPSLSALVWSTVADVPQNYHVVKALCVLCTWPLPTKSTSTDPTFMLAGLMKQIALQTGLHRPGHGQEFSRIPVELRDEDVQDRLKTWIACNIVLQTASTGFGQPAHSVYDWTLLSLPEPAEDDGRNLTADLYWRLQVERFCDKISQTFYNNRAHPVGITSDPERVAYNSILIEDYRELERRMAVSATPIDNLHLAAAMLHLRLSAFFDHSDAPSYMHDLLDLYFATTGFLNALLNLPSPTLSHSSPTLSAVATGRSQLQPYNYASSYLMQMTLACGFTLLKLLNSFFASHIDVSASRNLFNATVRAVRGSSVSNNDLPSRLAEVLAQLWRSNGAGLKTQSGVVDNSLQLRVRCRMSMSLMFDSVWRWREEFIFSKPVTEAINLDRAVEQPTEVGEADGSDGNSTGLSLGGHTALSLGLGDTTLPSLQSPNLIAATGGMGNSFSDYNYEVFDPLTWMLDSNLDLPYADSITGPNGMPDDAAFFNHL